MKSNSYILLRIRIQLIHGKMNENDKNEQLKNYINNKSLFYIFIYSINLNLWFFINNFTCKKWTSYKWYIFEFLTSRAFPAWFPLNPVREFYLVKKFKIFWETAFWTLKLFQWLQGFFSICWKFWCKNYQNRTVFDVIFEGICLECEAKN